MKLVTFKEESRRIRALDIGTRADIADMLKAAGQSALADDQVVGGLTVLFTLSGDPILDWRGLEWEDLDVLSVAVQALRGRRIRFSNREPETPEESIAEAMRQRKVSADYHQEVIAKLKRDKPWVCEHCDSRYKTERGANQHERRCYKNPKADQLHLNG